MYFVENLLQIFYFYFHPESSFSLLAAAVLVICALRISLKTFQSSGMFIYGPSGVLKAGLFF